MTTIPTPRPTTRAAETERAIDAVAHLVHTIVTGELHPTQTELAHPIPVAFLDDGRRVFLVIDNPAATAGAHAVDRPRSWGVEIARDGDLVGRGPGDRTATRTTRRLTAQAAAEATRYLLGATA